MDFASSNINKYAIDKKTGTQVHTAHIQLKHSNLLYDTNRKCKNLR